MQTCMAEISALHEVILDDGVVLLDKGCQSSSMAVRSQLLSSIQGMRVLQWQVSRTSGGCSYVCRTKHALQRPHPTHCQKVHKY